MALSEIRVIIAAGILIYASVQDIKYREINDLAWKTLLFFGIIFAMIDAASNTGALLLLSISILVMAIILIPLERLKKIGGGDVRILMGLSILIPQNPYPTVSVFPVFSLSAFTNAIFLTTLLPIYFIILNIYRGDIHPKNIREIRFLLLGYKKNIKSITDTDRIMKKTGGDEAWITPAIPFIVPLTFGFLLSVLWGDIPSYLVIN